jgi:hypothetical protein
MAKPEKGSSIKPGVNKITPGYGTILNMSTDPDYGGQTIDLSKLNSSALAELKRSIDSEISNRALMEVSIARAGKVAQEFLKARDSSGSKIGTGGEPTGRPQWVQPQGAHDAYPLGYAVSHNGKLSSWREFTEDGTIPDFVQPTGAHDMYVVGEQVVFEGEIYTALESTAYSPADYPAAWELYDDGTVDPEPEPEEPSIPVWTTGQAYAINEEVIFEGNTYRCRQAHTSQAGWTPSAVPSLWLAI